MGSGTAVRFDTSSLLQPAARLALGYGKEAVQAVSATDAVELIADLQSQMSETTAANARAAVWAAFVRQNPDRLTAVPDAWRKYSARTLTDFTATDLLRAGETLAYLQKQAALTVDYVTVAVVDAPGRGSADRGWAAGGGEFAAIKIAPARSGVGYYCCTGGFYIRPLTRAVTDTSHPKWPRPKSPALRRWRG